MELAPLGIALALEATSRAGERRLRSRRERLLAAWPGLGVVGVASDGEGGGTG
jgi:hypothetical protein